MALLRKASDLMAYDRCVDARLNERETRAGRRSRRKQFGENGHPQVPPTPEQQNAANRTKITVNEHLKLGIQELE